MMANENPTPVEVQTVRSFLREFYFDEESADRAASGALRAYTGRRQEHLRVASALKYILDTQLPDGLLQQLVWTSANRDVLTDAEAREFLERVFDDNSFRLSLEIDEIERGQ
ncbi:MAG: hypothetical protein ACREQV_10930 [Candidatus Binatia bacterium]